MTAHDRRVTGTVRLGLSSARHPGAPTASSSRRNACIHRVAPLLCPHLSNVVPTYRTHVEPGRRHHDRLEPLHVGPVSTQGARSPSDGIGTQMTERFLVTGAFGCLGAWVVHELVTNGTEAVAFDIGQDDYRIRYLVDEKELTRVTYCKGDITDAAAIAAAVRDFNVTNVIHLAALQMPFCAASPSLGAAVNVLGTINVFEAVKNSQAIERPIVYSSSVAAYDAIENPEVDPAALTGRPMSHYGVYKFTNEANARVFAKEDGLTSIGLRPHVVYGVGRDQGRTADPTLAMLAAARGVSGEITFSGTFQLQYARDVARAFIAASRATVEGAEVMNVGGAVVDSQEVAAAIGSVVPEMADRITVSGEPLPFPSMLSSDELKALIGPVETTVLKDGIAETIDRFSHLIASGKIASYGGATSAASTATDGIT
jgi:UDP-glucuronate 4-epimerase